MRLRAAAFLVFLGCCAVIAGTAVIFWPAGLILFGLATAVGGAILIDIPEPEADEEPDPE